MPTVSLYVPVLESRPQVGAQVLLPTDLKGRRIGLLDNSKGNADLLLAHVAKVLDARYGVAAVVSHAKPSAAQPAKDAVMQDLASCDLVINGIGD